MFNELWDKFSERGKVFHRIITSALEGIENESEREDNPFKIDDLTTILDEINIDGQSEKLFKFSQELKTLT